MEQFTALKRKALEKYFSRMNDQQRKAVFKIKGPLLILAYTSATHTTQSRHTARPLSRTYSFSKTTLTARQMTLLPLQTLWHMTA